MGWISLPLPPTCHSNTAFSLTWTHSPWPVLLPFNIQPVVWTPLATVFSLAVNFFYLAVLLVHLFNLSEWKWTTTAWTFLKVLNLLTRLGCFSNATTVCKQGLYMVILQYQWNLNKLNTLLRLKKKTTNKLSGVWQKKQTHTCTLNHAPKHPSSTPLCRNTNVLKQHNHTESWAHKHLQI